MCVLKMQYRNKMEDLYASLKWRNEFKLINSNGKHVIYLKEKSYWKAYKLGSFNDIYKY